MKRKKGLIITINNGLMNYGNRLQNYALQESLLALDMEVKTLRYKPKYEDETFEMLRQRQRPSRTIKSVFINRTKRCLNRIYNFKNKKNIRLKRENFDKFVQGYINWTEKEYTIDSDYSELSEKFDFAIAGSDQIWNPYWEGSNPVFYMGFMPEKKRIAYAASFGVARIPDKKKKFYTSNLNQIPNISCREIRGVEIVKQLTGKDVSFVLDPTLLLDASKWRKIEKKPVRLRENSKYILVYMLGSCTKEYLKKIREYRKKFGYIVYFLDQNDKKNSIFASPEEFVYLVNHAALVCTDSFHGCVFSIIFNVPFVCFTRTLDNGEEQDMSSRFDSLFQTFGCQDRMVDLVSESNIIQMNYKKINEKVEAERQKSILYLKQSLCSE